MEAGPVASHANTRRERILECNGYGRFPILAKLQRFDLRPYFRVSTIHRRSSPQRPFQQAGTMGAP